MPRPDLGELEEWGTAPNLPASVYPAGHANEGDPTPWSEGLTRVFTGLSDFVANGIEPARRVAAQLFNAYMGQMSQHAAWASQELRNLLDGTSIGSNTELADYIPTVIDPLVFGQGSTLSPNQTISSPDTRGPSDGDQHFTNLTVNSTLTVSNVRIFVRGTLTIGASGVIEVPPGVADPTATLPGGLAGGDGSENGGFNGAAGGSGLVIATGTGGNGGDATSDGGAGGSNTGPQGGFGEGPPWLPELLRMAVPRADGSMAPLHGGAGGGGGGSDPGGTGGDGGDGGGVLLICANTIDVTAGGLFRARGQDGGAGSGGSDGGGGQGGVVVLVYRRSIGATLDASVVDVAGGATGGVGGATAGDDGRLILVQL